MPDPRITKLRKLMPKAPFSEEALKQVKKVARDRQALDALVASAKQELAPRRDDKPDTAKLKQARLKVLRQLESAIPAIMELNECNPDEPMSHDPGAGDEGGSGIDWGIVAIIIAAILLNG